MARWRRFRPGRKSLIALLLVVLVLTAARVALPYWIKDYVNDRLDAVEGYDGQIGDVDVHLWRGAYSIHGVRIVKTGDGDLEVPLYECELVDLSIYWKQLWNGALVGEVAMLRPRINFVDSTQPGGDQTGAGRDWTGVIEDLFPFRIDRVDIRDGQIKLYNFDADPPVEVYLSQVDAVALNLTNSQELSDTLMAKVAARGLVMDEAEVDIKLELDPYADRPTFNADLEMTDLDVRRVSPLLAEYAPFDLEGGRFSLAMEIAADRGVMTGYVKPIFKDMRVLTWKDDVEQDKDNPLQLLWELIVGVTGEILENQPEDQFATKIPLKGEMDRPDADLLEAIGAVFKNAFVRAFMPEVDDEVDLADANRQKRADGDDGGEDGEKAERESEPERRVTPGIGPPRIPRPAEP